MSKPIDNIKALASKAARFMNEQKYELAMGLFGMIITQDPDDNQYYILYAKAAMKAGKYNDALSKLQFLKQNLEFALAKNTSVFDTSTKQSLAEVTDLIGQINSAKSYTTIPVADLLTTPMTPAPTANDTFFGSNVNPPAPRVYKKYGKKPTNTSQPVTSSVNTQVENLTTVAREQQERPTRDEAMNQVKELVKQKNGQKALDILSKIITVADRNNYDVLKYTAIACHLVSESESEYKEKGLDHASKYFDRALLIKPEGDDELLAEFLHTNLVHDKQGTLQFVQPTMPAQPSALKTEAMKQAELQSYYQTLINKSDLSEIKAALDILQNNSLCLFYDLHLSIIDFIEKGDYQTAKGMVSNLKALKGKTEDVSAIEKFIDEYQSNDVLLHSFETLSPYSGEMEAETYETKPNGDNGHTDD